MIEYSNAVPHETIVSLWDDTKPVELRHITVGDITVEIKPFLSLEEMMRFVNEVSKRCFVGADEVYTPELKDFLVGYFLITAYTNITLPDDASSCYEFVVRGRSLINKIIGQIDEAQLKAMLDAIDEKIDTSNELKANVVTNQLSDIYGIIGNLSGQFEEIFKDITPSDMQKMTAALSNVTLNDEKLVKAVAELRADQNGKD